MDLQIHRTITLNNGKVSIWHDKVYVVANESAYPMRPKRLATKQPEFGQVKMVNLLDSHLVTQVVVLIVFWLIII